jgi:integrase
VVLRRLELTRSDLVPRRCGLVALDRATAPVLCVSNPELIRRHTGNSTLDPKDRVFVAPKSPAGRRRVPIAALLRAYLRELAIVSRRADLDALVFGDAAATPFDHEPVLTRARKAWKASELERVGGLHAARHTAASVMIAAGVNVKAVSTFMGHSSITITLDRYGHLLPGSITEATTLLDAFLARTTDGRPGGRETNSLQIADS